MKNKTLYVVFSDGDDNFFLQAAFNTLTEAIEFRSKYSTPSMNGQEIIYKSKTGAEVIINTVEYKDAN